MWLHRRCMLVRHASECLVTTSFQDSSPAGAALLAHTASFKLQQQCHPWRMLGHQLQPKHPPIHQACIHEHMHSNQLRLCLSTGRQQPCQVHEWQAGCREQHDGALNMYIPERVICNPTLKLDPPCHQAQDRASAVVRYALPPASGAACARFWRHEKVP